MSLRSDQSYMKNEAVTTRPIATMNTANVGYQASGTGLVIDFGAYKRNKLNNQKQDGKETESEQERVKP